MDLVRDIRLMWQGYMPVLPDPDKRTKELFERAAREGIEAE